MSRSGGEHQRKKAARDLAQWLTVARRQCLVAQPHVCSHCARPFQAAYTTDRRCPACRIAAEMADSR